MSETKTKDTCFMTKNETGEWADYDCEEHTFICSQCHYEFVLVNMHEDGFTWTDQKPNYCPDCGRKVIEAGDQND